MNRNDGFGKAWIIEHAIPITRQYSELTIRQLYYRLVAKHEFPNTLNHYKRVVNAMTEARWDGKVRFSKFIDREREMFGNTLYLPTTVEGQVDNAFTQVRLWMRSYKKNRWENQDNYIEIMIEKKALQGVFETPASEFDLTLGPCKGYPSLTYLHEAAQRFKQAKRDGKDPIMLYYGDFDPSGQDIPRSIEANLRKMGCHSVTIEHMMLTEDQIEDLGLPGVPAKSTDSRSANWDGDEAVELDSVDPDILQEMCEEHVREYFNEDEYDLLMEQEDKEMLEFIKIMKEKVSKMDFKPDKPKPKKQDKPKRDDDDDHFDCTNCESETPKNDDNVVSNDLDEQFCDNDCKEEWEERQHQCANCGGGFHETEDDAIENDDNEWFCSSDCKKQYQED